MLHRLVFLVVTFRFMVGCAPLIGHSVATQEDFWFYDAGHTTLRYCMARSDHAAGAAKPLCYEARRGE